MNFTNTQTILTLFFIFFTLSQASFIKLGYKFKYVQAKDEYTNYRGDHCVHMVQEIKNCGKTNSIGEVLNKENFKTCVIALKFHEILANEAAEINARLFVDDLNVVSDFNDAYTGALYRYVKALDAKYIENGTKIENKLEFHFNWLPWVLLIVAFAIVYGLNNRKQRPSSPPSDQPQEQEKETADAGIYEDV